ncbi:hypothetical protein [Cellulomonas sp. NTE-D12]|uniref:SDH family Clp fold serine proteinase n=1 Tax=Cellulomonas sp. NTE-D12 TaxID=2962632 RepID=UPI00308199D5
MDRQPSDESKAAWLNASMVEALTNVGALRSSSPDRHRNVVLYASGFLQKPAVPAELTMITHEDLNGLMGVIYKMDCSRGLTLILHTPGGVTNAAESVVAYLRSKFPDVEVIVPALAMSAGTMISLGANRIIMGRQSQLGPIDPQMSLPGGRTVSARAVVEQFSRARDDVLSNPVSAHIWAPIVQSLGPALLQEADNALQYSEDMVARWLTTWMLGGNDSEGTAGHTIAAHFNDANKHKSHGRRIDRDEARTQGVIVEDLENSQELQEAVLTAYHLMTIMFERSQATKVIMSDAGRIWLKNFIVAAPAALPPVAGPTAELPTL